MYGSNYRRHKHTGVQAEFNTSLFSISWDLVRDTVSLGWFYFYSPKCAMTLPLRWTEYQKSVCPLAVLFDMSVSESVSVPTVKRGWLNGQGLRASPLWEFHWRDMSQTGSGWANGWMGRGCVVTRCHTCTAGHGRTRYMGDVIMDESSMLWCT